MTKASGRGLRGRRGCVDELHPHACQLDHVAVLQRMRGGAEIDAVDGRIHLTFNVRDDITGEPARNDRDLVVGAANCGQCLDQWQFPAFVSHPEDI